METIYLLLGSNLGDRLKNLSQAKVYINELGEITKNSSLYVTKAWGNIIQDDFLNQVIELKSSFLPEELLKLLKNIEFKIGRTGGERWGPRIIDIDILFYGNLIVETKNLVLPHPGIKDRRFVLIPLAEIAGSFIHPVFQESVNDLLSQCSDTLQVDKYDESN